MAALTKFEALQLAATMMSSSKVDLYGDETSKSVDQLFSLAALILKKDQEASGRKGLNINPDMLDIL